MEKDEIEEAGEEHEGGEDEREDCGEKRMKEEEEE